MPPDNPPTASNGTTSKRQSAAPAPNSAVRAARNAISGVFEYLNKNILVYVFLLAAAFVFIAPLKWALGITNLERRFAEMQVSLIQSEDTVFNFQYDFDVPSLSSLAAEQALLEAAKVPIDTIEFITSDFAEIRKFKDALSSQRDGWTRLITARSRFSERVRRSFRFSAAADAEVTLQYDLDCITKTGGEAREPVSFMVTINNHPIHNKTDWSGGDTLGTELEDSIQIIETTSRYPLRIHRLALSLFKPTDDDRRLDSLAEVVAADIASCSFDALIFVRDVPEKFEREDLLTWLSGKAPF